jgi:hypothetical protein
MHHNAHQLVVVVVTWVLQLSVLIDTLLRLLRKPLLSIFGHVELHWELKHIIKLDAQHRVKIEIEALQRSDQVAWQGLNARTLVGIDLLLTLFAHVLVVGIEHVASHELVQTRVDRLLVLHSDTDVKEGLNALELVRAGLADDFVCERASKVVLDGFRLRGALDCVLKLVEKLVHVLFDVHLLNHVYWVSVPILE